MYVMGQANTTTLSRVPGAVQLKRYPRQSVEALPVSAVEKEKHFNLFTSHFCSAQARLLSIENGEEPPPKPPCVRHMHDCTSTFCHLTSIEAPFRSYGATSLQLQWMVAL